MVLYCILHNVSLHCIMNWPYFNFYCWFLKKKSSQYHNIDSIILLWFAWKVNDRCVRVLLILKTKKHKHPRNVVSHCICNLWIVCLFHLTFRVFLLEERRSFWRFKMVWLKNYDHLEPSGISLAGAKTNYIPALALARVATIFSVRSLINLSSNI